MHATPGPVVLIRDARPEEMEAVARLSVDAYREFANVVGADVWARMERNLARLGGDSPDAVTIVAEIDGELVGTAEYLGPRGRRVGLVEAVPEGEAYIGRLGVAPHARTRRVGKALTEECIRRARADGARTIGLATRDVMVAARAMYESLGFRHVRTVDRGGSTFLTYVLDLTR
ncbi:MAG: GNAT family N-acetyltransferase [Actinomycetota bacterium]|nr:GNAT family N-acetyltransferase [Actinomycetota bacterium]